MKINQLRNQGTKLEVLEMTENWINDNIDKLFSRFDKKPAVNTKAFRKFNSISIQQTQAQVLRKQTLKNNGTEDAEIERYFKKMEFQQRLMEFAEELTKSK